MKNPQIYLAENFDKLGKYVDLSKKYVRASMQKIITRRLLEKNLVYNRHLAFRVAGAFIDFSRQDFIETQNIEASTLLWNPEYRDHIAVAPAIIY